MSETIYNWQEITKAGDIDALTGLESGEFPSEAAYADELKSFFNSAPKYLQYLPGVVVCVDDTRLEFIAEVKKIRDNADRLMIKGIIPVLNDLEEAADNRDVKVISDKLVQYKAKIEIIAGFAEATRITIEKKPLILIVDDMPEILTIITDILRPAYDVIATASVKDAQNALLVHKPDAFILDIVMPEENGFALAKRIRDNPAFAGAPIIFLTDSKNKDDVLAAKEFHSSAYILKPIDKEILLKRLAKALKM